MKKLIILLTIIIVPLTIKALTAVPVKSSVTTKKIALVSSESGRQITPVISAARPSGEGYPSSTGSAQFAIIPSKEDREDIARYFAQKYGLVEDTFLCVLNHESGLTGWLPDGSLKCGDNGRSCGIGQIQLPTWQSIRKSAGWSTEDLRGNDYENIKTTAYGMSHGWENHWTGYRICRADGYKLKASEL